MKSVQKLKIGLVFDDSLDRDDGVAQYVKRLGGWLSSQGHSVIYLVGETQIKRWDGGKVYSLSKNLPVKFNGNKLSIPLPANRQSIRKALAAHKLDILHVMVPFSPFMAQKVIGAVPKSTTVVGTFHIFPSGFAARAGGKLLRIFYGRKLSKFSSILAVSQPAANYAKSSFGIGASAVIPNPVDISKFSKTTVKNETQKIVFLGRLVKRKGCAELIAAFDLLSKQNPNARLVIAGDGPQRQQLENRVKKLGLNEKVEFMGYIAEAEKANLLASASIACFPSLFGESFGIVLIEAMAAGSGVVLGGNNPGYASVLDAQPALLINPKDSQEFRNRLNALLIDKDLAAELHQWQASVVGQYDTPVVGKQILAVYEQAIAQHSKKSDNSGNG